MVRARVGGKWKVGGFGGQAKDNNTKGSEREGGDGGGEKYRRKIALH